MWMSVRSLWARLRARQRTSATAGDVPAAMVAIVRVIGEDRNLQSWFRRLVALPENLRVSEIGRLVAEMRANGEDQELMAAFTTLGEIETCRTLARVLRDRYGVRIKIAET
jgi:hypothetical protein